MDDDTLSKAVFAALIRCSPSRLSQYISEGLIGPEALVGKGRKARIRPAIAQAHLRARLDVGQRKVRLDTSSSAAAPPIATEEDAKEAVNLVLRVLREEGVAVDQVDYPAARLAETILKARDRDIRIAERSKKLVSKAAVIGHIEKAFIGYRQVVQRMPSRYAAEMAATLGCDVAALTAALDKMISETMAEMSAPAVRS